MASRVNQTNARGDVNRDALQSAVVVVYSLVLAEFLTHFLKFQGLLSVAFMALHCARFTTSFWKKISCSKWYIIMYRRSFLYTSSCCQQTSTNNGHGLLFRFKHKTSYLSYAHDLTLSASENKSSIVVLLLENGRAAAPALSCTP